MAHLTVFDYSGKNIRFEQRGDRVWVSLTDMAKATGKLVADYTRSKAATQFLSEFEGIMEIPIMVSNVGGTAETTGTWAIEEVAIDFAAWCNTSFRIWVAQQIRTLMKDGFVAIAPTESAQLALPQTYIEALEALLEAEKEKEQLRIQNELLAGEIDDLEADNDRLSELTDELFNYSSIVRIAKFNHVNETAFKWRKLKAASQLLKVEVKRVSCPRFEFKNLYSHQAWAIAYPDAELPENPHAAIVLHD